MCSEISGIPKDDSPKVPLDELPVVPFWDWFAISDFQPETSAPKRDQTNLKTLGSV